MKKVQYFFGIILLFFASSINALVLLDLDFRGQGIYPGIVAYHAGIESICVQADGKIVGAGYSNENGKNMFAVFRYNVDGSLDDSFGTHGKVVTRFGRNETASGAHSIFIQPDGKIVAAGFTNAIKQVFHGCLARYHSDGSLDTTFFGHAGIVRGTVISLLRDAQGSELCDIVLQPDGKIVAAGTVADHGKQAHIMVVRYNENGSLDEKNFNTNSSNPGIFYLTSPILCNEKACALALQSNGKIVVAGSSRAAGVKTMALLRLTQNGHLDNSFFNGELSSTPGIVLTSFGAGETESEARAIAIQLDDKIVVAGYTNGHCCHEQSRKCAVARYDSQGRLDQTFGDEHKGMIVTHMAPEEIGSARSLVIQADGKIIVAGTTKIKNDNYLALMRYHVDGRHDNSFNDNKFNSHVLTSMDQNSHNELSSMALQPDGSLVIGGKSYMKGSACCCMLARYIMQQEELQGPSIEYPAPKSVIVNGSAIKIGGTASVRGIVHIYLNDQYMASVPTKGKSNSWHYQLPPLCSGHYKVNVHQYYSDARVIIGSSDDFVFTVDQNPVAINATERTLELMPVNGILQARGASGSYTFSILHAENGTVVLENDRYIFTPSIASGLAHFTFQATDMLTQGTDTGTVSIEVRKIPIAHDIVLKACMNYEVSGSLQNATAHLVAPLTFSLIKSEHGLATLEKDGSFIFIPEENFSGVAYFDYQIIDGNNDMSKVQTVTINVCKPPLVRDGYYAAQEGSTIHGSLNELVSGGTSPYTFVQVGPVQHATIDLTPNGNFIISLGLQVDRIEFYYKVVDADNYSSRIARVIFAINPKNNEKVENE